MALFVVPCEDIFPDSLNARITFMFRGRWKPQILCMCDILPTTLDHKLEIKAKLYRSSFGHNIDGTSFFRNCSQFVVICDIKLESPIIKSCTEKKNSKSTSCWELNVLLWERESCLLLFIYVQTGPAEAVPSNLWITLHRGAKHHVMVYPVFIWHISN